MRILIFSLAYLPFIGGAELAVKEITDRIGDVAFDLITVDLDGRQPRHQRVGNVTVYRVGHGRIGKYLFSWRAYRLACQLQRQQPYDAVWAIMANQAGLAALLFKRRFPTCPYILTLQEGDSLKKIWFKTWFMRPAYRSIYTRANYIQAISHFLEDRARRYGYRGPSIVIPNGVAIETFAQGVKSADRRAIRSRLGVAPDEWLVVSASRLVDKNGLDTLIKAFKGLDQAKLILVGSGARETKLKALACELGLKDRILFLGHITHGQLPGYLAASDIFVRPSRSEGLGSAFLEAMACGLPVVATPVGGIRDIVQDGITGLFCQVNNPRDCGVKIQQLIADPALRQRLIENGRRLLTDTYDWDTIARRMAAIFTDVARGERSH